MDDKYIAYGGRRGGGQLYHAVSTVERLKKELDEVKAERDSLARQIARVEYTDDPLTCERVIQIRAMSNEELEHLLTEIAYGREEPWSLPFEKACCDTCPTVKGTVVETGQEMEFTECDFTDGKCPHGDAVKWWLNQPVNQTGTDEHEDKQYSGLLEE